METRENIKKKLAENMILRFRVENKKKTIETLRQELEFLLSENEKIKKVAEENKRKQVEDIQESTENQMFFDELSGVVNAVEKFLGFKSTKYYLIRYEFSVYTVIEIVSCFAIGVIFTMVLHEVNKLV